MKNKLFVPRLPAILRRGLGLEIDRGRARAGDVAFTYRMGAGFPGDVNRTHPFSVEPALQDPTNPILGYGFACVVNTAANSVRQMAAGDTALTAVYGILARPYPTQQQSGGMSSPFGQQVPPATGVVDVLKQGYVMVPIVGQPTKGGAVFVWVAASSGSHVQGGFEAAATGGSTIALGARITFNGPPDANGIGELIFND